MTEYSGINYSSAGQSLRKRRKTITMKRILSEAERKEILDETTVKNYAACVLTVMKKLNIAAEEAIAFLDIPAELQDEVLREVKRSRKDL